MKTLTHFVAGIDEAGRGPLAGPVTAACVVLTPGFWLKELNDSKKLSEVKRDELFEMVKENSLAYSVISVGQKRIDTLNIRAATQLAMRLSAQRVLDQIRQKYNQIDSFHLLIDGNMTCGVKVAGSKCCEEPIIKGDAKIKCIAAASILAKVTRDRLMERLDQHYPNYGLKGHKGYPTAEHYSRIRALGPSKIHRLTFAGVVAQEQLTLFADEPALILPEA